MNGNWAFSWVLILHHNWRSLGWRIALVSLIAAVGLIWLPDGVTTQVLGVLLASTAVMAVLMGVLFDTKRAAVLHLSLSALILILTFALAGWWLDRADPRAWLLGGVVVLTMMTSNLVHVLGATLREMARGQFQHDAVAEGLKHNAGPVVLANLTTVCGFVIGAWVNPDLVQMAWIVALGALASLWVTLTWLPWILLRWFLEFRVGNPEDRHGFSPLVRWLMKRKWLARAIGLAGGLLVVVLSLWALGQLGMLFGSVAVMLAVTLVLLGLAWGSWAVAQLAVLISWLAVAIAAWGVAMLLDEPLSALALLVPLGLVIDDAIHFFTRYVRAMRLGLFDTTELRVRFALGSVGRTIWMTTLMLVAGLSVLLTVDDGLIRQAVLLTDVAMVLATALLVIGFPALALALTGLEDKKN